MGRLPEAWIAPPATRELRELVRHRAKLVGLRSHCKAEVHAVLAKCGVQVLMSDLFGLAGTELLDRLDLPAPYAARIASLRRLMDDLDFEIDVFAGLVRGRMAKEPGYTAVQKIPGIGPTLGAVLVAEIGDITRFASASKLTCWAGLTPKHHESDTHVRRGRITKQGSRLVRWAAIESVKTVSKAAWSGCCGNGSPTAVAATSAASLPPGASWSLSSTRCATATYAPWNTCRRRHEHRLRLTPGRRGSRAVMTPNTLAWSPP
jgi:transposase